MLVMQIWMQDDKDDLTDGEQQQHDTQVRWRKGPDSARG